MEDVQPRFELHDDIAVVTFNNPVTLNGLSPAVFMSLSEIIAEVGARAGQGLLRRC